MLRGHAFFDDIWEKNSKNCSNELKCTANVQSWFTNKLRHLSVASTSKWLFWDFFEKSYNHRQLSVKKGNNYHIQHKNWENLEIMKNIFQNDRQISVVLTQSNDFSVNTATDLT